MRKIHNIFTFLMFVALGCMNASLRAQSYVGFSVSGDVPLTFDKEPLTHMQPAYGGDIGFVYEWRKKHFFLQTGLHYAIDFPTLRVDSQHIEQDMIDTRGIAFLYRGTLDKRTDRIIVGQASVPFYVGGEWSGVYFMVGAKAVLNVHATSKQKAQLMTVGDYIDRYYEWLEDMPNHGYHDYVPTQTSKSIQLRKYDVRVGGELGYSFALSSNRRATPPMMRVGLFGEYGLMTMVDKTTDMSRTMPDYSQYMNVDMTHMYAAREGANAKPHMFVCGIRLTVLFPTSSDEFKGMPVRRTFMTNKGRKCNCE